MLYDRNIREPLFDFLEERLGKVRIIEEKTLGRCRADVMLVLPGKLCGLEIKSDADSYERLARQVKAYDRFFDENYVAVGTRHALHIEEHVPKWWGIITVENTPKGVDFYCLRQAEPNPKCKWKEKLSLLWRPELAALQQLYGMPKYAQKSKAFVRDKLLEWLEKGKITEDSLRVQLSEQLFERDYTLFDEAEDR